MATTADQVEVILEAQTGQYIKNIVAADKSFAQMVARAEKNAAALGASFSSIGGKAEALAKKAAQVGQNINSSVGVRDDFDTSKRAEDVEEYGRELDRLRAKFNPLFAVQQQYEMELKEISAAQRVGAISTEEAAAATESAATRYKTASEALTLIAGKGRIAQYQMQNLAFQFQDIGMMMASGQNPFTLLVQQLPQITMYGGSLNGVMGALRSTIAGLISPLGLTTAAFVLLGSAAISYFSSINPKAETANEAIARHRKAIEDIVDGYESARDAAGEYFDSASALPRDVAIFKLNEEFAQMREEAEKFKNDAQAISSTPLLSENAAANKIRELGRQFSNGEINASQFYLELNKLSKTNLGPLGFEIQGVIDRLEDGALKVIAFGNAINQLVAQSHALAGIATDQTLANFFDENSVDTVIDTIKGLTPELRTQKEIIEDTYNDALKNPALTDAARDQIRNARDMAIAAQDEVEARKKAEDARRKSEAAAKKSADELKREKEAVLDLIDALTFEHETMGASAEDLAVLNNLRKAGAAATSDQLVEIENLTRANFELEEAQKAAAERLDEFLSIGQSGVQTFISDILDGKSAVESLGDALNQIGSQLINMGLNSLFSSDGLGSLFGGGKAVGGPVSAGTTYLVGEKGPELFRPASAGSIVPNNQLGGSGMSFSFAPTIDARGADVAAVARLEVAVGRMQSEFVGRVREQISTRGRKWQ